MPGPLTAPPIAAVDPRPVAGGTRRPAADDRDPDGPRRTLSAELSPVSSALAMASVRPVPPLLLPGLRESRMAPESAGQGRRNRILGEHGGRLRTGRGPSGTRHRFLRKLLVLAVSIRFSDRIALLETMLGWRQLMAGRGLLAGATDLACSARAAHGGHEHPRGIRALAGPLLRELPAAANRAL